MNEEIDMDDPETRRNIKAPILLKDFIYDDCTVNKSYYIKQSDLDCASFDRSPNSISMTEAIKLRWKVCIPSGGKHDIARCRKPISEFVQELGLELWIDMQEIVEIRDANTLNRLKAKSA